MSVYKNSKTQMTTVRIPHDVMEAMEAVKQDGESNAGFIVTAMRGEIARRQLGGTAEDALASARDALSRVRDSASKAGKEIEAIIASAEKEIGRSTAVPHTPSTEQPAGEIQQPKKETTQPAEPDKPAVKKTPKIDRYKPF